MKIDNFIIAKDYPRGSVQFCKKSHFKNKEITAIEIGVSYGKNALSILKELNIRKLYLIDPYINFSERYCHSNYDNAYQNNTEQKMLRRLRHYKHKIELIKKKSGDAINGIKESVDFIYIDGNHDYEFVKKDIELYWKLLKPNGVIAGHDFNLYPVAKAVVEFCNKNRLSAKNWFLDWYIVKP